MPAITESDIGSTYWCTSEEVRADFQLEIRNREPDFEERIKRATRRVRAWYQDAAGQDPPDTPPELLRDATALMAASLAHQAYSQNIQGQNQGDQRHVFLEDSAMDTFEDWKAQADIDPGDETSGDASDNITGQSGVVGGEKRSPIDRSPKPRRRFFR